MSASGPGRRAVVRWAWRMFRRDWRQQVLVLALVTVAVGAAVAGTAMAVTGADTDHGLGDANAFVRIDTTDPEAADAVLAAVRARFGAADLVRHDPVRVPGFAERLDLRALDPGGRFTGPLLALLDGRYPTGDGEVALTPSVAEQLGVGVGGAVELDGRRWDVVGEVENPSALGDEFALLAPGTDHAFEFGLALIDEHAAGPGTASSSASGTGEGVPTFGVRGFGDDDAAIAAVVLVVVTLAMALTALIAAAGFVVVAQRRQRQLGLLAALGATDRHLRLVMVANGCIVGVIAAGAGLLLGIAGWFAAAPAVEEAAEHRIDRLDLPWGLEAICLLLAVLASVAAAWWPARSMARMPVVAALARRPRPPLPVHRSLALAVVLSAAGIVAVGAADPLGDVRPLLLVAGLVAVVAGVVLLAPAAIRLLVPVARHLPLAPRLALRDLARYQARSAGALGAIALGLGVSVAVLVVANANTARPDEGNLADRQLLLRTEPDVDASELAATVGDAAAIVGPHDPLALELVVPASGEQPPAAVVVAFPIGDGFRFVDLPYVATPAVLAHFGIDPASIEPGVELLSGFDRVDIQLVDPAGRSSGERPASVIQRVELSPYTEAPQALVTEAAIAEHGWVAVPAGWLVEADHPITDEEVAAVRTAVATAGLTVEARDDQDSLAAVRTASTAVGVLLALAIVAMAISLLRGESIQDVRTLVATGATARTRRALTATTAGALATLGATLSLVGAYAASIAAYHDDLRRLAPVPTANLLAIAVGLPLVAAAAGWLLAGREPRRFTRQALD